MSIASVRLSVVVVLSCAALWLCLPSLAGAHALTGSVVSAAAPDMAAGPTATAFVYSDGSPAAYVQAEVYAPGQEKTEYQNGRTDQNGVFAFVPDKDGVWRVIVADTQGHRAELSVPIALKVEPGGVAQAVPSASGLLSTFEKLLRAVLGVSLLCNICLIPLVLKRRSAGARSD